MTEQTKTYTLSKVQQLVDLNNDVVNFRLKFHIESKEGKPFQAVVVSQSQLDSDEDIQFQNVDSVISGDVENNNNVYQNYYILLKSDTPVTVNVTTLFEPLPEYIEEETPQTPEPEEPKTNFDSLKTIILIAIVACVLYMLYTRSGSISSTGKKTGGGGSSLLSKLKDMPIE
jgi:hypothetical protein